MIPDIWIYIIEFLDLEGLAKYRLLDHSFRNLVEAEVKNNRLLFNRVELFLSKFIPNFESLKTVIIENWIGYFWQLSSFSSFERGQF